MAVRMILGIPVLGLAVAAALAVCDGPAGLREAVSLDTLRANRRQAITSLEEFLRRNPDEPRFVPGALIRLAGLEEDQARDDHETATAGWEKQRIRYEHGEIPELPPRPEPDLSRAIARFRQLVERYPASPEAPPAALALGFLQEETGSDESLKAWRFVTVHSPGTRLAAEAWMRIGEHHFDSSSGTRALVEALEAYDRSLSIPECPFRELARYKRAWTLYRLDRFAGAAAAFRDLLVDLDAAKQRSPVRAEAAQYLAIVLAEPDWDSDGRPDASSGLERARAFLLDTGASGRDVLVRYGDLVVQSREEGSVDRALEAWAAAIGLDPDNPGNEALGRRMDDLIARDKGRWGRVAVAQAFKRAEKLFESGAYLPSAQAFQEIVDQIPRHEAADRMLFNAAVAFGKAGDASKEVATLRRIVDSYPKSALADHALFRLSIAATERKAPDEAIQWLRRLVDAHPESRWTREALWNLGVLLRESGKQGEVAAVLLRLVQTFPAADEAPGALMEAAMLLEKAGGKPEALRARREFLRLFGRNPRFTDAVVENWVRLAALEGDLGHGRKRIAALEKAVAVASARSAGMGSRGATAAAEALFHLTQPKFERLRLYPGKAAPRDRWLDHLSARASELDREYQRVAGFGSVLWATAAGFRMAEVREVLAAKLRVYPPRGGWTPGDRARVEESGKRAAELVADAARRYRDLLDRAAKLDVENEWTRLAREALERLSGR